jgi:hypothetical protein
MYRLKTVILLAILLSGIGCSSIPFKKIDYVSLDNLDPQILRQDFGNILAQRMQVVNSIVFQYKFQRFSALGYTELNLADSTFAVSCMNPVGIKLFELTGNQDTISPGFVLKELLQRGDLPRAVGEDIRRIYFKMIPSPEAKIKKEKCKIIFNQAYGQGIMKYVFAGNRHLLTEKHYYEKNRNLWSVFYYEYSLNKGKLYPSGLILKNHRFGYNLVIRLKEVR